jgi:hypothetical protein
MPGENGYQEPERPSKKGTPWTKIVLVVIIIAVIGVAAVLVLQPGGNAQSGDYSTREIEDYNNEDIELYPTFYRAEFSVSSSETQTDIQPDLHFEIDVNTGSDDVTVDIVIAVYDVDLSTFDTLSWSELDNNYQMDKTTHTGEVLDFVDLHNYSDTYTWIIWFEASSKADVWDVDITLTLRYNWT